MTKKETWKFILQTLLSVLSAIATAFGVSSCIAWRARMVILGVPLPAPPIPGREIPFSNPLKTSPY